MNLLRKEDKVFTELYLKKKTADRQWDRVFREALHGEIKQDELAWAMEQCNKADFALIEFENAKKVIKQGSKGLSDEEFAKKYIEPYSKSKAP
jgi:hypothetical protein